MNKRQLSAFTFGMVLLAASCRKMDKLHQPASIENAAVKSIAAAPVANTWQTTQWNSNKQEKFTTFSTSIKDSSITLGVMSKGLVLVYLNHRSEVVSLPHQQKESGEAFWYHQLSKSNLQINCDAYDATTSPSSVQIKYFVITPDKLTALAQAGYDKMRLMTLSYENTAALLK